MKRWIRNGIALLCMIWLFSPIYAQRREGPKRLQNDQIETLYLTPEQEKETLAYIERFYPDRADEIKLMKDKRPAIYIRGLSRAFREMRFLQDLESKDPEQYKQMIEEKNLEKESRLLGKKYRELPEGTEKDKLLEDLKGILERSFDLRQMNRQVEIDRLESRLQELKDQNKQRLDKREEIIQHRLSQIIGEKDLLEW